MSVDRSMRNAFAALLLVAALFIAMDRIVASAPFGDWWLPIVLLIVGLAFIPSWSFSRRRSEAAPVDEAATLAEPAGVRSYSVAAQPVPRLHTMTIRPDPEATEFAVTVTDESGAVLPFMELTAADTAAASAPLANLTPTPVSPETPAPAIEPEPESAAPVPASPETPAPAAPAAATIASPETPAPAAAAPDVPEVPEVPAASVAPAAPDDLARLNGIGPKSAAALAAAGIATYAALAASSDDALRAALSAGSVRLVGDVDTWAQQAAFAARGDWDGLRQYNAGRKAENGD